MVFHAILNAVQAASLLGLSDGFIQGLLYAIYRTLPLLIKLLLCYPNKLIPNANFSGIGNGCTFPFGGLSFWRQFCHQVGALPNFLSTVEIYSRAKTTRCLVQARKRTKVTNRHSAFGIRHSYTIGIDFGTNSVRALVVDVSNGDEAGTAVFNYPGGTEGILLDPNDHNLARQSPADYIQGLEQVVCSALADAEKQTGMSADNVIGLGLDTTGSTPVPVDEHNCPMCIHPEFKDNLNAYIWLWKDHTGFSEAARITEAAANSHPEYLAKCGGIYSSEWYWSKLWHCLNVDPTLFNAAYAWVEMEDYIPAILCGITRPENIVRGVCAAGHKAMYNRQWGGMPDNEFLSSLDPKLAKFRDRIPERAFSIDQKAGSLCAEWAEKLGLKQNIPVAVGAFDAHLGAVGSGIKTGTLVKIIGTSTCDIETLRKCLIFPVFAALLMGRYCQVISGLKLDSLQLAIFSAGL